MANEIVLRQVSHSAGVAPTALPRVGILVLLSVLAIAPGCGPGTSSSIGVTRFLQDYLQDPDYPQDFWPVAAPEDVGLDSSVLDRAAFASVNVHSMLVVRRGKLVFERYLTDDRGYPIRPDQPQIIYSATKSVTSALVGLVVEDGLIHSIDDPVLSYFDDRSLMNGSADKAAMTIGDVLTMQSGLAWSEGGTDLTNMYPSPDAAQYVLDKPMAAPPGTRWNYSTGNSQILTALVQNVTGTTVLGFAQDRLFAPLGITNFRWDADEKGVNWGGTKLYLTPRDMAKFGYLFLQHGQWQGAQVVPASWVAVSTAQHATATPPFAGGYGYHWWRFDNIGYLAAGYAGQWILVIPEQELIIVFTSSLPESSVLRSIVYDDVLAATL